MNQLVLEISGQTWPLKDGDVLGRFSSVASDVLKNFDVLSRQHLKVENIQGAWHLTLLPNVRNATWLDGRLMQPSQPLLLGAINDITVDTVHLRLKQTHSDTVIDALVNHPIALVTIDAQLNIQKCNTHAQTLLGNTLRPGSDFASCFQGHSLVQLRMTLDKLQPQHFTDVLELELASASDASSKWISARFAAENGTYLGALQDITAEVSRRGITKGSESRFLANSEALTTLLASAPFREGDLPASLPLIAQQAADLLEKTAVTLWLKHPDQRIRLAAAAGPVNIQTLPMETTLQMVDGILDLTSTAALKSASIIPEDSFHVLAHHHEEGLLLLALQRPDTWMESEEKLIHLLAALFDQAIANAQRSTMLKRLQAREESLKIELNQASRYVSRLLPAPINDGTVQVDWKYQPCGGLGGDVFGYEMISKDHMAFYVVDVAGHGIGAALLAVSIVNTLRIWIERKEPWLTDPAAWLHQFNTTFPMEKHGNLTWTAWCGIYHTGKKELAYASGGHPSGILLDRGQVQELGTGGPVLGALQDITFQSARVKLHPGAKLYLYTDGAYEFPHANGETGSGDEFVKTVAGTAAMNSGECAYLHQHAAALCGSHEFPDDFTLLRVRF